MRVLGNSTCSASFPGVILMPRSVGYSSFEAGDAPDICTVSGPSILQTATKVCCGDRIPKATGVLEFVTSDIPRDRRELPQECVYEEFPYRSECLPLFGSTLLKRGSRD